jgi:hypothetical protein
MQQFFKKLIWKLGSTNGLHLTEVEPWGDVDEMYQTSSFYAMYETNDVLKALYEDQGLDLQEFKKLNKWEKLEYCVLPCEGGFSWNQIFIRKAV